ncbi:hypothetical protein QO002_001165 [Pararhizobium capsulatum DSM 1112]|uniref:Uncharacterized protein n=1 Tax=Pararhizobium capsulatum DSM 1112 TaxID=1121113 RepID=A0ABU0BQ70_9HYPH|nr:hypothetical protein [Pararhizobium capsulatum]MDQ0319027.1 hypothetical protein [Pararhizobium capsulatum DSM 1112]
MADSILPQVPVVHINFQLRANTIGWASCDVAIAFSSVTITASYLGDALKELVDAACLVMSGETQLEAHFWEEPGEYRWVIDKVGESIRIRIIEFDELWSDKPIEAGKVLVDEMCEIVAFGAAVLEAADRVMDEHGLMGYAKLWGEGEFPAKSVTHLRELVRSPT